MKNVSRKHHYLPEHYLGGFTNHENVFYVYDKKTQKIFPTNPNGAFFENDLNTVTFPDGSSSDFLEGLYTKMENQHWGPFDRIRQSTAAAPVHLLDKMHVFMFLMFLYWRTPSRIGAVEELSAHAFLDDNDIDFFKLVNKAGQKAPQEVAQVLRQSQAFKKSLKQIAPLMPFVKDKEWGARVDEWRLLYTEDDSSWFIVGDDPIVVRDENVSLVNPLKEFVFPLSGRMVLVNTEKKVAERLPREFVTKFDTAIIERAQRFVACRNREFLEALIRYHGVYVSYGKTDMIIPEVFGMLA